MKIKGLQDQIDNITGNQGITDEELAGKLTELENKFQGLLDTLGKRFDWQNQYIAKTISMIYKVRLMN